MSNASFDRLRLRGLVHRQHSCVFTFGCEPLSEHARLLAAVDACGPGAVLSGPCAAWLWGLRRGRPPRKIDVIVPRRHGPVAGVSVHQTRALPPRDVTVVHGIPVVSVARLLVEVAAQHTEFELCDMIDEAAFRDNVTVRDIRDVLRRSLTRPGRARLVAGVNRYLHGDGGAKSGFESRAIARLSEVINVPFHSNRRATFAGQRMRPDVHIPSIAVVVEIDGAGHRRPTRRRDDEERDARYREAGQTPIRIRQRHEVADLERASRLIEARQAAHAEIVASPAR